MEQSQLAQTSTSNTSGEVRCGYKNFYPRPEIVELQVNNYTEILPMSEGKEVRQLFDGHSDTQIVELHPGTNTLGCKVDGHTRSIVVHRAGNII